MPNPTAPIVKAALERMARRHRQLRVRNPDIFLPLPATPLAHRHPRILRALPVDHAIFCFRYPDLHHGLLDDFAGERKRLEALGLQVETTEHSWVHWRSLYVTDPEGNQVELVCYDEGV
jgi:hypothetical protein